MARKKEEGTDRIKRLREEAEKLSGIDRALLDDMLIEYDALATMTAGLRLDIIDEGVMVDKEVGSVNNRHMETVENPKFTTYQKAIARMGDLAKKVSDFAKRSENDEEEDELVSFIRG